MHPRSLAFLLALGAAGCGSSESSPCIVPVGDSPVRGPADAWVTMIEFGDFECPYCGAVEPTLDRLYGLYPEDLRVVYKHLPLPFHAGARPAAIAAECARAQGKFWEMHDELFGHQPAFAGADLDAYAASIGLDVAAFAACRSSSEPEARIAADEHLGELAGVHGTPTFFANGAALVGAQPLDAFESTIDTALRHAEASGRARADYYISLEAERGCRD